MANLLTGDYDAVLQVSEATLNRLLASMHQNAWSDTTRPSFPHTVGIRLGDDAYVDGVQGTAWVQIGVPRLGLIDGSTNTFEIVAGLRIRYRPDEDTEYLPTYSHGSLHATYEIADISPTCFGWGRVASKYLWVRVVDESVSFRGSYGEDPGWGVGLLDEDELNQKMGRQLASLLANSFAAAPQRLSGRFRQRLFKGILEFDGLVSEASTLPWVPDVPIGGHAVAIPISLTGGTPAGSIDSVEHVLVGGRDMATAVSRDVIMGALEPALDQLQSYGSTTTITITVDVWPFEHTETVTYTTGIDANGVSAVWMPNDSYARIVITANGHSNPDSDYAPSFDFVITQPLHLEFDAGAEALSLWAENATAQLTSSVPLPQFVWDSVSGDIRNQLANGIPNAVANAQSGLASLSAGSAELAGQLQQIDARADAHFDEASFYVSGIVFRGWISVAPRRRPRIAFDKVDDDTLSALQSWIPGGRVDRLRWSWTWTFQNDPEELAYSDRFVIRRDTSDIGRFGPLSGGAWIPGLDGDGTVCLSVSGVVVDPVTGQFTAVETEDTCRLFGYTIPWRPDASRLFVKKYLETAPPVGPPGPVEAGLIEVTARGPRATGPANTLVVFVDEGWTDADARTLADGVSGCTREDAGLLVVLVLREGMFDPAADDGPARVRALADRLEAPLLVSEDVHGGWSNALGFENGNGTPCWRLLSPDGGMLWKEDERIEPAELAAVLDGCLYPSAKASPSTIHVELDWGPAALATLLGVGHQRRSDVTEPGCPPFDGLRHDDMPLIVSAVSFVHKDAASSSVEVDRLRAENEGRGAQDPGVVLVLDGATDAEANELGESLGSAFMVIADPDGSLAAGAGVRSWPTTVAVGDQQRVGG
jgi:hypothetical protein